MNEFITCWNSRIGSDLILIAIPQSQMWSYTKLDPNIVLIVFKTRIVRLYNHDRALNNLEKQLVVCGDKFYLYKNVYQK